VESVDDVSGMEGERYVGQRLRHVDEVMSEVCPIEHLTILLQHASGGFVEVDV